MPFLLGIDSYLSSFWSKIAWIVLITIFLQAHTLFLFWDHFSLGSKVKEIIIIVLQVSYVCITSWKLANNNNNNNHEVNFSNHLLNTRSARFGSN